MSFGCATYSVRKTGQEAEKMVSYVLRRTCSLVERDEENGNE